MGVGLARFRLSQAHVGVDLVPIGLETGEFRPYMIGLENDIVVDPQHRPGGVGSIIEDGAFGGDGTPEEGEEKHPECQQDFNAAYRSHNPTFP
jgi:hypothetical protein